MERRIVEDRESRDRKDSGRGGERKDGHIEVYMTSTSNFRIVTAVVIAVM